jgi:hypothetical protein
MHRWQYRSEQEVQLPVYLEEAGDMSMVMRHPAGILITSKLLTINNTDYFDITNVLHIIVEKTMDITADQ